MKLKKLLFIPALLLSLAGTAVSQSQKDPGNLKIGLVFSGGGAKCMAQIGALYIIDSMGIKIDHISGTSMGAIIGSMYALGYSVEEIESYMRRVDWDALLSNEIPRNRLSYSDRKSESRYLLTFPIVDNKVQIPTAINYAQYILKQLSYLGQQSYRYDSFRDFPIPFLCVATNLENGELVVFEDGRLLDALRASSAFPSLFTPYHLDGKLYVDGGIANNYPVEQLKERGMDYIIGVDVQDFLYTKGELNSLVRILEQTSSFVNASEYTEQLALTDCYIHPKIPQAGLTTFELFDSIIEAGKRAARQQLPKLMALAEKDPSEPLERSEYDATPMDRFYISRIEITGNKNSTDEYILGKLRIACNDTCSISNLNRGMDLLYGSKYFENIDYTVSRLDTGYQLNINVREKQSLSMFRVGLHYDTDFGAAILLNYTKRNLIFKNSRLSLDFAASENPRVNFDYFVDRGLVPTLGLKFRANKFNTRVYENGEPILQTNYLDFSMDFFIQSTLYDALAVGGGLQLEGVDISQDIATSTTNFSYKNYINYYGFLDFDSFNRSNYPSRGTRAGGSVRLISERQGFNEFYEPISVIEASISQAFRIGSNVSGAATFFGASTIGPPQSGNEINYAYGIFLGGLGKNYINYTYPFAGYRFRELITRNVAAFRTDLYIQFIKHHYIALKGNIAKSDNTFDNLFRSDILLDGYSLGYSYDSPIGPLELHLTGSTNHSGIYTYINLGFWF